MGQRLGKHHRRCFLDLHQIAGAQVHVVEQEDQEAFRHGRRVRGHIRGREACSALRRSSSLPFTFNSRAFLDDEPGNDLELILVEDLKVFFFKFPTARPSESRATTGTSTAFTLT